MNKSIKILFNYFLGPVLLIILCWSLYRQVIHQADLNQRWQHIRSSWKDPRLWTVIFLVFINWGIEARKWQLLVAHVQHFTFLRAFKSVLSGCSVTMLTPNRVGEYGGRILYVEQGNRIRAISLTIVGSISQLLVTMIMGCLGLLILRYFPHMEPPGLHALPEFWELVLLYVSAGFTVFLFLFYIRLGWLVRIMERVPAFKKIITHIGVLDEFSGWSLVRILSLSFVRYLVFVMQYVLLLQVMGVEITSWTCFWLMTMFYLVMAIAPTIGFLELPIRAKASVEILGMYAITNTLGIQAATLGIWLINLVFPALIGSLLILGIKIVKEK